VEKDKECGVNIPDDETPDGLSESPLKAGLPLEIPSFADRFRMESNSSSCGSSSNLLISRSISIY
jgi:hypothetical protein